MTDIATEAPPGTGEVAARADERISHRGPMQRWLISPEIGALIGAVIVWAFFWGTARTFGEADSTLNWLDVAAPIGIMAVAVALLMIGGEFDLSSGVMTGATAIMIGLMATYFGGEGIHIGWAIGAAFLAAAAIGWFNGYMVNATGLPSFIVTLGTFFVLRGVMLVMSKRLAGKVQVADILDQRGAAGFKNWIAHEWKFTDFAGRDEMFLTLVLLGVAMFTYGLLEQSFIRRSSLVAANLIVALLGLVGVVGGFAALLNTDGIGANVAGGLAMGVGAILLVLGVARTRWVTRTGSPAGSLSRATGQRLLLGILGVVLACLTPLVLDRTESQPILTWISPNLRPVVAVAAALLGIGLAVRAQWSTVTSRTGTGRWVKLAIFATYSGAVSMVMVLAFLQLATVQALRAILMLLFGAGGFTLLMSARGMAAKDSRRWQLVIGLLIAVLVMLLGFVIRADAGAVRFRTGMFSAVSIAVVIIVTNTLLEYMMEKRKRADTAADHLGGRLQLFGMLAAVAGMIVRLLWSNPTAEQAAQIKAEGGSVGQNVLRQPVVWWLLVAAVGAFVLGKTKWGNWIFAVGGNNDAARAIGVPANRVRIGLFVTVSLCGCLAGTLIALRYGTVQANQGTGLEFEYIIAAVVGGCLLTGGYGSVIGASLGAAIMAMSFNGVQSTGWNSDGRFAFLGGVLLLAVLVNNYTRKKAQEAR